MSGERKAPPALLADPSVLRPGRVCEAAALFRPRRPERTTFYAQLEKHFEDYTDPVVVDRILAHRKARQLESPFAARAPPAV